MKYKYINIDKSFIDMPKLQLAFLVFLDKLTRAKLAFTNKEACEALGVAYHKATIPNMIRRINETHPGLIEVNMSAYRNSKWSLKNLRFDKDTGEILVHNFTKCRSIKLTRPLHIKGEEYINIPSTLYDSVHISGNELFIIKFLKSIGNNFKGYQKVLAKKLSITLSRVKYALNRLKRLNLINIKWFRIKHKIKNSYYTQNVISFSGFEHKIKTSNLIETKESLYEEEWPEELKSFFD